MFVVPRPRPSSAQWRPSCHTPQIGVPWPASLSPSRRLCQHATSSVRALKKSSTDAAPRDCRGCWQHATPSEEGGQHRRHTTRAKWRGRQPPSENRSTFTPPRGLNVERSEKAKLSHGKRGHLPPQNPKNCVAALAVCCFVVVVLFAFCCLSFGVCL